MLTRRQRKAKAKRAAAKVRYKARVKRAAAVAEAVYEEPGSWYVGGTHNSICTSATTGSLHDIFVEVAGKRYRIDKGWAGNVKLIEDDKVAESLCIHPVERIPDQDNMLGQKLMLEWNEDTASTNSTSARLMPSSIAAEN